MAILALDLGERKIGLAFSDQGKIAQRLESIKIGRAGLKGSIGRLQEICQKHQINKIIIGLPKTLRQEIGPQARIVKNQAQFLAKRLNLPIIFEDETFSSSEAAENLANEGFSQKKIQEKIDSESARIILQNYLEKIKEFNV